MSNYLEWSLPLNPPNPYGTYLKSVCTSNKGDSKVYYSKYIIGVIGELDTSIKKDNVREWVYPASLRTPSMGNSANITHLTRGGQRNFLYFTATDWNGVVGEFRPSTGLFTVYSRQIKGVPAFTNPRNISLDQAGSIWFLASSPKLSSEVICRMSMKTKACDMWAVPESKMMNCVSLTVDASGSSVWVSSVDPNFGSTKNWIAHFDVPSAMFTCYSPAPYVTSPRVIDIKMFEGNPSSVWFAGGENATIYRYDISTKTFSKHLTVPGSWPRFIALEPDGSAWVSDLNEHSIIRCVDSNSCGQTQFVSSKVGLKKTTVTLTGKEALAKPVLSSSAPVKTTVVNRKFTCAQSIILPDGLYPDEIQAQVFGNKRKIYFVNWGINKIGMVEP